jgi:pilus assembly protein CpaF
MSQRIYVVVNAKGGVGATTIAFELARRVPGAVGVLVDADLTGRRSHAVQLDRATAGDDTYEPGVPSMTMNDGILYMELTRSYEDGFAVTEESVDRKRRELPHDATIVVDAPQPFAAAVRPFTMRAAAVLLVTEPTLLGAAAARGMLRSLLRFGVPKERIVIVLNEAHGRAEIAPSEIERALDHRGAVSLPAGRDRAWTRALEQLARALPVDGCDDLESLAASVPGLIGERRRGVRLQPVPALVPVAPLDDVRPLSPERERIKVELHEQILAQVDFQVAARAHADADKLAALRAQVEEITATLVAKRSDVGSADAAATLRREVVDEAVGLGPIETLLRDNDITEIMVNGFRNVYIERRGRIERTALRFASDRQVRLVIDRIIAPLGRRIDEASPMVDARMPDGSRVNAIIGPLAIDGPALTIRRFGSRRLGMDDLVGLGSLPHGFADFLRAAVEARLNVVVSGGTGSGKTTLLNALSSYIPRTERIVTIEDAAELALDQPHVVRLESRPANIEGTGSVAIRDLVRNALRMRPDRVVIGECRSGEALDMLQAMNTGHDGSLTTVHANAARDALSRIETMVLMAGFDLPVRAIREQIASALDIVVHVSRLRDGARRVLAISEVVGMESDIVTMQDVAVYRMQGVDAKGNVRGRFESTGVQPVCLKRFEEMGIAFDLASLHGEKEEAAWAAR